MTIDVSTWSSDVGESDFGGAIYKDRHEVQILLEGKIISEVRL